MKSEKAPSCHPMASFTAKHCIQRIEENGGKSAEFEWIWHTDMSYQVCAEIILKINWKFSDKVRLLFSLSNSEIIETNKMCLETDYFKWANEIYIQ